MPTPTSTTNPNFPRTLGAGLILTGLIVAGVVFAKMQSPQPSDIPNQTLPSTSPITQPSITLTPTVTPAPPANFTEMKAFKLADSAKSACTQIGTIGVPEVYNPNSQTWWFKLVPDQPQPGCSPACVVHLNGDVEVNWRCTGLKTP